MEKQELLVKGIHGGVLITLPVLPWFQQRDLLVSRIQTQERFFKGGRIALDVGESDWSEDQLQKLLKDLADEGVCLWTILSLSELTLAAAAFHGIPTSLPNPRQKTDFKREGEYTLGSDYVCLIRSLKTGESYQHNGNLIFIGDVDKGAMLAIKGSLLIWGSLAGTVVLDGDPSELHLRLLKYEQGKVVINGKDVEFPSRQQKNFAFEIRYEEGEVVVKSLKSGEFKLL